MLQRTFKPVDAAKILGMSRERLVTYERDGKIPDSQRDEYGNRFYTYNDIEKIRDLIQKRPKIQNGPVVIAVFNMKGGVGKSTISSNLAWKTAERGYRTLAIDADPQGHMTTSLGQEPADFERTLLQMLIPDAKCETARVDELKRVITPTLDLAPANLSMCSMNLLLFQQPEREYRFRRAIERIKKENDYNIVVVDSPPAYDLTSLNILLACDFLLAPVKLDGNSFYGLQYLFDSISDIAKTYRHTIPMIKIVANHYHGSYSVSRQILDGLQENYGDYVMSTVIRQDVSFDKANALRQPVFLMAPTSKGSRDLESMTDEALAVIRKRNAAECSYEKQA